MRITRLRVAVVVVVFAAVVTACAYSFLPRRDVQGTEFSPDLLTHRAFRYQRVLWFRVSDYETKEFRTPLEEYIVDNGWVTPAKTDHPRWYLIKVHGDGGQRNFRDGPMKMVCHALGCYGGNSRAWVEWSRQDPQRAEELWKKVYAALREERFCDAVELTDQIVDRPPIW